MSKGNVLTCSNCDRGAAQVKKLIRAATFIICDECICACVDTLRAEGIEIVPPPGAGETP